MIKQAIIPLAGQGTRLMPITSVLPKELLPINGKPGLEYILDECLEAGVKEIIACTPPTKGEPHYPTITAMALAGADEIGLEEATAPIIYTFGVSKTNPGTFRRRDSLV